ncbi:glycosyltransferase [Aquibacillus halophilus]|uniref:Glycosyltransferase n=1 Tax=Aquibacillus halophilus TaxID=930132 RepID=A0A6A8D6U9_9BACI|nr:glycosyltransferase [Aquibacillus halophilus]MRH41308.1 glycosyltransferase [Aquibacillus halophilus]
MTNKLISIVMPVYNGENYVQQTIQSVLSQTHKNFELLILNDGSKDDSLVIISEYKRDPRVQIIDKKNTGVAKTRNMGLDLCSGHFVAFLDQDDLWENNYLEKQVNILEETNGDLIYANGSIIDKDNKVSREIYEDNYTHVDNIENLITHNFIISPSQVLAKLSAVLDVGKFYESKVGSGPDDWGLWLRVKLANKKIIYNKEKLVGYRLHESNNSYNRIVMEQAKLELIESIFSQIDLNVPFKKQKLADLYLNLALSHAVKKDRKNASSFYKKSFKMNPSIVFDKRTVKVILKIIR